jgi:hypothetical protein
MAWQQYFPSHGIYERAIELQRFSDSGTWSAEQSVDEWEDVDRLQAEDRTMSERKCPIKRAVVIHGRPTVLLQPILSITGK